MNQGSDTLEAALALLRQSHPAQAEHACRRLLQTQPGDFGARHLLGVLLLLRGQAALAEQQIAQAIQINPGVPGAWYNHGNALAALGRDAEAVVSFDQALRLRPDMAEALCNRGNAQAALRRFDDAIASYQAAIAIRPGIAEAHINLGNALLALGRNVEALARFDNAIAHHPVHAGAWNNRGNALYALGRLDDASASYERATAVAPGFAEAFNNRGMVLQELRRFDEAIASHGQAIALNPQFALARCRRANAYRQIGRFDQALLDCEQAIALRPGLAEAFNCRGVVLHDMGRLAEALADYEKAALLDANSAEAFNNLGNVLHDLGRTQQALDNLQQAIALRPDYVEALNNRGMVLQDAKHFDEAREAYDTAITLKPDHAEAYKRRATLNLLQGRYREGWGDYEASLHHAARRRADDDLQKIPYWSGQSLQGRSIVFSEGNGLGDAIQFFRYLPAVIAMGAEVSFLGSQRMVRLLGTCSPQVRFLSVPVVTDDFDYHCELWSLPHIFGSTLDSIPNGIPYLVAESEAIAKGSALLSPDHFNIGIGWQGKPDRKIDIGRSIPLVAFHPLCGVPGVRLISLQKNFGLEQLDNLPVGMSVVDPGPDFDAGPDAFVDTAGLMMGLDLVVTSDTSLAHLAGALGRPAWLGLKYVPEWRWLLERADSPWYPTLRLFRQRTPGDWSGVFEEMAAELRSVVQTIYN